MNVAGRIGLVLLGLLLGCALGGGVGILGGLTYTGLADTSDFEGYSGFVVAFWMLGGILLGMIIGVIAASRWSRR